KVSAMPVSCSSGAAIQFPVPPQTSFHSCHGFIRRCCKQEGPPFAGGPSIVGPRSGERTVTRDVTRPGPRQRQDSSSRLPANTAIDNETLDHLLSVGDDESKGNRKSLRM